MSKTALGLVIVFVGWIVSLFVMHTHYQTKIAHIDQSWQERLDQLQSKLSSESSSGKPSPTAPNATPAQILSDLRESCERIENLSLAPAEQQKEIKRADQLVKQLESTKGQAIPLIEASFKKPGILEFKRRLMRAMGKVDTHKGFDLAESTFLREGEDPNVRWAAAAIMKEIDKEQAEPIISKFLIENDGSRHPGLLYLIDYLRDIGTFEAKQTLLRVALDIKKDASIRYRAVDTLGDLKMVDAIPHLHQMMEQSGDAYLRRNAARALILIKPEEECAYIRQRHDVETDAGLQIFLRDLINERCR